MGKYAILTWLTAELHDDLGEAGRDDYARFLLDVEIQREGLTPVADPVVKFTRLDEFEAATLTSRYPDARTGDWILRAYVRVAEDAPVPV